METYLKISSDRRIRLLPANVTDLLSIRSLSGKAHGKIGIGAGACLSLLLLACPQSGRAENVCQGGDEIAASCSALVQKEGYYVIHASAEATADKSSQGDLWMDVFINDAKRGHAETVCEDGGLCRVSVVLNMLLKAGKPYKVEAKQGNNRADTKNTRISVRAVAR